MPISSREIPVSLNNFCVAGTGPYPIVLGLTPAVAIPRILAAGSRFCSCAIVAEATINAAAPSLIPEALPAVMVPFSRKGVESSPSFSSFVSGRGCSSCSTTSDSPLRCAMLTGKISSARRPDSMARPAFC